MTRAEQVDQILNDLKKKKKGSEEDVVICERSAEVKSCLKGLAVPDRPGAPLLLYVLRGFYLGFELGKRLGPNPNDED